jgi:hypothetical protein
MAVYKNIKSVRSLTNASLTSIVDITNLNFNSLSSGILDFLSNINYDETSNNIALNQGEFNFVNVLNKFSLLLDGIPTFTIDALGRAEGQEILVKVSEAQRRRFTDFNNWPDVGIPGEIIYTGIQNQKDEFGEDFIGYLQSRGWVSLTGLGQNYITLTELTSSPPIPPIPGPNQGTIWIGAQGYETMYEALTQTVYYTDQFGNIFDILSDFVWERIGDDAKFKLNGKVIIGETSSPRNFQYVDGNQTTGYVLTCDAQGNASWQPVNNSGGSNCSYVIVQNFTAGVTNTITHNLGTTSVVVQLIKTDTNENITGYVDNYQLNTIDVTLSQSLNTIKIIVLSADCQNVISTLDATNVDYDNSISGLSSINVQDAIDELSTMVGGGSQDLNSVLSQGDNAGGNNIDLNDNKLNNCSEITATVDLVLNPAGEINANGKNLNMVGSELNNCKLVSSSLNTNITIEGLGNGDIIFKTGGSTQMTIPDTGTITTTVGFQPNTLVDTLNSAGTSGQILKSTGSGLNWINFPIEVQAAASDETTALTTGTAKTTFRLPAAFTLTGIRISLTTAQASGSIFTVDVNLNASSILSTKLTIDNGEKTSVTAATPAVISTTTMPDDGEITVDIDQVGDGTATGLKILLLGYRS